MMQALTGLRRLLGLSGDASTRVRTPPARGRNVMMRVTLDAQHATPLRRALIRDCADQPWTIRVTPLHGTQRVRLSLYLPGNAVSGAIQRVAHLAPTAEWGHLVEIPDAPTDAWRDLTHPQSPPRMEASVEAPAQTGALENTLTRLITEDHVLLDMNVASRDALFEQLGRFFETHHQLPAASVTAALQAREALGSTALGQGVAVPHGQIKGQRRAMALYVRPALPIPFDAPDGKPVTDVVMLLVPEWANSTHLHLLADVAQRFCDHRFREPLHACVDAPAVCRLFAAYDIQNAAERGVSRGDPVDHSHTAVRHFQHGK